MIMIPCYSLYKVVSIVQNNAFDAHSFLFISPQVRSQTYSLTHSFIPSFCRTAIICPAYVWISLIQPHKKLGLLSSSVKCYKDWLTQNAINLKSIKLRIHADSKVTKVSSSSEARFGRNEATTFTLEQYTKHRWCLEQVALDSWHCLRFLPDATELI